MAGTVLSRRATARHSRGLGLAVLWLGACTPAEPPPRTEPETKPRSLVLPADLKLTISRTGCYGSCPAYEASVDAQGRVRWNGEAHVDTKGPAETELASLAPLEELWTALDAVDYAALPPSRANVRDPRFCPEYSTDSPGVEVRLEAEGTVHRVYDYQGCHGYAPMKAFRELEDRIDAVLGTAQWIGEGGRYLPRD